MWCRKPGSNRYAIFITQDFKSRASANSAIPAFRSARSKVSLERLIIISQRMAYVNRFAEIFLIFARFCTNAALQTGRFMISLYS